MSISAAAVMELRNLTGAGLMDCKQALQETSGNLEQARDYLRKKGIAVAAKKSSRETSEGAVGIAYGDDQRHAAMVRLACETDFVARNEKFGQLLQALCAQILREGESDLEQQTLPEGDRVQERMTAAIATMGENLRLLEAVRLAAPPEGLVGGYIHSNARIGVLVALAGPAGASAQTLGTLAKDVAMHIAASEVHALSADDLSAALIDKEREIYAAQARESGKPEDIIKKMIEGRLNKFVKEVTLLSQPFVKAPDKTIAQLLKETGAAAGGELRIERFVKFRF